MIRFKTKNGMHILDTGTKSIVFFDLKKAWEFIFNLKSTWEFLCYLNSGDKR